MSDQGRTDTQRPDTKPAGDGTAEREPVVVKDNRKIDPNGQPKTEGAAPTMGQPPAPAEAEAPSAEAPVEAEVVAGEVVTEAAASAGTAPVHAELQAVRGELEERVRDLQRVSAEYANYRKRVERDRTTVMEQATAALIGALLPVLDDLDRAREHDDLVGPAAAMADQLTATLGKFGLTGFGEVGDPFDPTRHEAVSHATSADVTEPTCVSVMRRGYMLGDRLLRAALVGVADPE